MNIFYVDPDPKIAAQSLADVHVSKMILESAQILCTAHRLIDGPDFANAVHMYQPTHINHPCSIWVRESLSHYHWLVSHALALGEEFVYRYGHMHGTLVKLSGAMCYGPEGLDDLGFIPPPRCMPDEYKVESVVESYRNYYRNEKQFEYTRREKPEWLTI